jgi:hypothetical protein
MDGPTGTGETESATAIGTMPPVLRERLRLWVDLDVVGDRGLWSWLATILPLLPPRAEARSVRGVGAEGPDRLRAIAVDLVECAGDRARLTIACEQYVRDNQLLARRVKALESILRTEGIARGQPIDAGDPKAAKVADRYMPRRAPGR